MQGAGGWGGGRRGAPPAWPQAPRQRVVGAAGQGAPRRGAADGRRVRHACHRSLREASAAWRRCAGPSAGEEGYNGGGRCGGWPGCCCCSLPCVLSWWRQAKFTALAKLE
uniref:Cysteine-rich transmembrane CYSTM domain-containing protein n=1 Tax=Oryza nivara TaxID=4536 RepID=A0A0E0HJQ7_ORYNI